MFQLNLTEKLCFFLEYFQSTYFLFFYSISRLYSKVLNIKFNISIIQFSTIFSNSSIFFFCQLIISTVFVELDFRFSLLFFKLENCSDYSLIFFFPKSFVKFAGESMSNMIISIIVNDFISLFFSFPFLFCICFFFPLYY